MENTNNIGLGPMRRESQRSDHASTVTRVQSVKSNDEQDGPHSFRLRRSLYGLIIAAIYTAIAVASWALICQLRFRVSRDTDSDGFYSSPYYRVEDARAQIKRDERTYHIARVLQAIAAVLALPVTSTVCASAAVIYMQRHRNISLRQVMALADREWMDLYTHMRMFSFFGIGAWKRYGTSLLLLAMLLSLLGLVISPIQAILLSMETVKSPAESQSIRGLFDLPDAFPSPDDFYSGNDGNLITVMTRSSLETATLEDIQAQLWRGTNVSCNPMSASYDEDVAWTSDHGSICEARGNTLEIMPGLPDPFLAELPTDFNTGLIQQFAPRVNSTAHFENITEDAFPTGCDQVQDGFFVEYSNTTTPYSTDQTWAVQACMPVNVTDSPWKSTRNRQDFSEVMYLNITMTPTSLQRTNAPENAFYRLTLDTTAGYFELPNYMNGEVAGPLLESDPVDLCGANCAIQGWDDSESNNVGNPNPQLDPERDAAYIEQAINKGPLLTLALALFGNSSFIETALRSPDTYNPPFELQQNLTGYCLDIAPLTSLLDTRRYSSDRYCQQYGRSKDPWDRVYTWLDLFHGNTTYVSRGFTAAAFLANKARIQGLDASYLDASLVVSYDLGADVEVPSISVAGVIVLSILIGIHLLALLALGIYAAWEPRWTTMLDSFAMMRMAGCIEPPLPMKVAAGPHRAAVFERTPGWVGDLVGGEGENGNRAVGRLGVGADLRLRKDTPYEAFHKDPSFAINSGYSGAYAP